MNNKKLSIFLALILLLGAFSPLSRVQAKELKQVMSEPVGAGAVRYEYEIPTNKGKAYASVVKCDLNNPNLKVTMVMGGGTYTQKATVSQMAERTGAVALVNGDFFNMKAQGAPLGASVIDGRLASAPMNSVGYYALGIDKSKTAFIEQITFGGFITASNGAKYPIQGLNKAAYEDNITGAHSHDNTINLYNDLWTAKSRGAVTAKSIELLVSKEGLVEEVSEGNTLKYAVPEGKIILQANDKAKNFIVENVKKGDKVNLDYKIRPEKDWDVMIGGHGILVDNSKVVPYTLAPQSIDGLRARTAVGVSQDGKTMWVVAVEAKTERSQGINLKDLATFMANLGSYKAVNLDGGGSTAMSSKHTGELAAELVVNPESNGNERYVVNGLGVYNTAEEGPLTEIKIKGPSTMLLGETAEFSVLGWDANYIAKNMEGSEASFTDTMDNVQNWSGKSKLAAKIGKMTVNVSAASMAASKDIDIVGASGVKTLELTVGNSSPKAGDSSEFKLVATTKMGRKVEINPNFAQLYMESYDGAINTVDKTFQIANLSDNHKGYLVANYDGMITKATFVNPDYRQIHMNIGKKVYTVQGEKKEMDTSPIIVNNRTMVPLRFLVESFGGEVNWNEETREVEVVYAGKKIVIPVDSTSINVNGEMVAVDSPAIIKDNRTIIPIRIVSESLGMIIEYETASKSVEIYEKINVSPVMTAENNVAPTSAPVQNQPTETPVANPAPVSTQNTGVSLPAANPAAK